MTAVIPRACVFSSRPRDLAWSALEFDVAPREILTRLKCAEFRDDIVLVDESSKLLPFYGPGN